jgi:hypothetical protein
MPYGLAALLGLAAAVPALGAEITFYERDGFRGRSFTADQSVQNFANIGFNDRASSVRVLSGTWQICSDAYFRGRCVTVTPGEYPSLRSLELNDLVSSARELDWLGGGPPAAGGRHRVQMYERYGFDGGWFDVDGMITDFADVGFNDRAQSMVVHDGTWEACEHANFRGACQTFGPGRYPSLGGLGGRISSIRVVGGPGPGGPLPGGPGPGGPGGGRVEFFDGYQFDGRSFAVNGIVTNFSDVGFNDRAQSMIIRGGLWEVCEHADFRGRCETYGPGRYPNLGAMAGRISSIRPVGGDAGGGWGTGSRALLYEGPNLSGRSFVINTEIVANLANTGFNDRASSLRIEGGYWIFCSDANFHGECLTFGPGDYPTLPWGLNNRISSGRRVQSTYPYNQNPTWPR